MIEESAISIMEHAPAIPALPGISVKIKYAQKIVQGL